MPYLAILLLFSASLVFAGNTADTPSLLLANNFHPDIALGDYWVSEKFDGVRAYWNGKQLVSRNGHPFIAPEWFTRGFPTEPLDGELWLRRGGFEQLSAITRNDSDNNEGWKNIRYLVFDAPQYPGNFNQRLAHIKALLDPAPSPYIETVKQWRVADLQQLRVQLEAVVSNGGEGLMLHRGSSLYKAERSDDLLKLKPFDDAEAVVVGHLPGQGKYRNMMGSIEVVNELGQHFRIGSGFSDAERQQPPAIGSTVTYRFNGKTRKGLPRFPRFLRIRREWQ